MDAAAPATPPPAPIDAAPPVRPDPKPPKPPTRPDPRPRGPTGGSGGGGGKVDLSKLGVACSPSGACDVGTCVSYYGIAGKRGGEFKTCEITCKGGSGCPAGSSCRTIADGPGQVCRP